MEVARCPEVRRLPNMMCYVISLMLSNVFDLSRLQCGRQIGGSNHTLTAGNRRDEEMEALLRPRALQSPWAWAR